MAQSDGRSRIDATGRWVLFAAVCASSMAFIEQSALNLALPAIQIELDASGADLLWIVNIYQLLLGALILVGGSLGDHFGRKRVYIGGIALFAVGSLLCGISPTTPFLIASRAVQGVGGAMMIPGSLAIISAYFSGAARGQAIGIWSSFTTVFQIVGPVAGGFLAENGLWRGVFLIAIPFALMSLYALLRHVPESRDEEASKELDYTGALLITLGLAGIVYGATEIGRVGLDGFQDPLLVGILLLGFVLLAAFIRVEMRSDHPMMPPALFRSSTFSGANVLTLFLYGALAVGLFFLPLNLVQVQGYGETMAGLAVLPFSILLIILSPRMGSYVDRKGPRLPLTVGPALVAAGFFALALPGITAGPASYWLTYFPGMVLIGLGMGFTVAPLTTSVMGSVPQHRAGTASGVNNAVSRSAGTLATAILGGVALLIFSGALNARVSALSLPSDAQSAIMQRADDLATVPIPASLDEAQTIAAQSAVDESFITTFRAVMVLTALMCLLGAFVAYFTIEPRLQPEELEPLLAD